MVNLLKRTNRASSQDASLKPTNEPADTVGQGRLAGFGPVAVIDVGSNSVRLVAYERLSRALTPIYNEKVQCGLGRGLSKTGMLSDESVTLALSTMARFRHLVEQMQIRRLQVIATAAVREASNGAAFIMEAERILETPLTILSGDEEARAAAFGVQSGFYKPDGIVGDLGGGSLELVSVQEGGIGEGVSHKLGVIRMQEEAGGEASKAFTFASKVLSNDPLTTSLKGRTLFLVGGTWRNLAKLHMEVTAYPLSVMHGYAVDASIFAPFCADVMAGEYTDHPAMSAVSRGRRQLLPFGAAVLSALFKTGKPKQIVLSALGVREGILFNDLPPEEQVHDPLLDAAYELAVLRSRSPQHARELADWTGRAFAALGHEEDENDARLRRAASLLADIGWRAHPDYRGIQSHNIIAHAAFTGIDHPGRLFLAMANLYRHAGLSDDTQSKKLTAIVPKHLRERAVLLGALFRVAYALTASMAGILPETRFELDEDDRLVLILPEHLSGLRGERLAKRVNSLSRQCGCPGSVVAIRR